MMAFARSGTVQLCGKTAIGRPYSFAVAAVIGAGIGIAGDTFDYRIIDNVISPLLGKGDVYRIMGNALPVPPEYFAAFARWHRLSMMRAPRTLRGFRAASLR